MKCLLQHERGDTTGCIKGENSEFGSRTFFGSFFLFSVFAKLFFSKIDSKLLIRILTLQLGIIFIWQSLLCWLLECLPKVQDAVCVYDKYKHTDSFSEFDSKHKQQVMSELQGFQSL